MRKHEYKKTRNGLCGLCLEVETHANHYMLSPFYLPKGRTTADTPNRPTITLTFQIATSPEDGVDVLAHGLVADVLKACVHKHGVGFAARDVQVDGRSIYRANERQMIRKGK